MLRPVQISPHWRFGFEIEVVLGALDDQRFFELESDPMDVASPIYCRAVAKALSRMTGFSWIAPMTPKSKPGYYVFPEYDLDPINFPDGIVAGVELITPPLALQEADDLRHKIADAVEALGGWPNFERNNFTEGIGWHINVDAGTSRTLEVSNFVLGTNEVALLVGNGRYSSSYASPQRHAYGVPLLRHLQVDSLTELANIGFDHLVSHHCGCGKRYAANFEKLSKGYVELRHFGVVDFLGSSPLSDLMSSPIAAIQMDHASHAELQQRELRRFEILRGWLNDIRPSFSHTLTEPSRLASLRSGTITFRGEPAARTVWNGTAKIAVLGKDDYSEIAIIYDQQYPDLIEAFAVLALDIAEIRASKINDLPLRCNSFSLAVVELERRLKDANLMTQFPIKCGSWWNTLV